MHAFFFLSTSCFTSHLTHKRAKWLTVSIFETPTRSSILQPIDLHYSWPKNISLFLKTFWRVFPREWLTSIPLVWPYCIPVLLLPLERDSELLRERESVLRLRERRWLDGASFDTERGSTSREGEPSLDKKSIPVQSPVSLGEELQWWPDKVRRLETAPPDLFNVFQFSSCNMFLLLSSEGQHFWFYTFENVF